MNNIAPKLQKCWTHKIAFNIISKMLKQPNFFYSQPSTLPKDAPAKFYLSTTFKWFKFCDKFCSPYSIVYFYAYLITKIGNRNLKQLKLCSGSDFAVGFGKSFKICFVKVYYFRSYQQKTSREVENTPLPMLLGLTCRHRN